MKRLTWEEMEKLCHERQQEVAHIHEAGHVIAARFCQLKIESADVHVSGKQCGRVRLAAISVDYTRSTGLPKHKEQTLVQFNRQIVQLLAGPAAQAIYFYENNIHNLNELEPLQPEMYGILLEFSKDESFCDFAVEKLTNGMAFFLNETGGDGDWKSILKMFKDLPYSYYDEFSTVAKRNEYLQHIWLGVLEILMDRWEQVTKVAEVLKRDKVLTGEQIESILA